jgi:hypothetical protein
LIHDGEMDSAIIIPDYEKEQVRIITSIGGWMRVVAKLSRSCYNPEFCYRF